MGNKFIFTDMTVCLENQSESTENLLQTLKNSAY